MVDKQAIGKRINELRLKNGLTQDDFAQKLEIKRSAISQLENGIIAPSLDLLTKICTTFEVSIDWIINGGSVEISKHNTVLTRYSRKLTENTSGKPMLPSNEETLIFLKSLINQKEADLNHSNLMIKYLQERMQSNALELETLKKLLEKLEENMSRK
jgi:transcriptional regulator with XRE-family HTH domain